jgi:uncharacterized DUF497 family protein
MMGRHAKAPADASVLTRSASGSYGEKPINMSGSRGRGSDFEWDPRKDLENQVKHGVAFWIAQHAFADPDRVIAEDVAHSGGEPRYFCIGRVADGVLTVRFTYRDGVVRIFGAGYWRKGKLIYERENPLP